MTATGNISDDVEAIRRLVAPGSRSTLFTGWPWGPPASQAVLARAQAEWEGLPEEVLELFAITETFNAGFFTYATPLKHMLDHAGSYTFEYHTMVGTDPVGKMFRMLENDGPASFVEIDGPYHGRLVNEDVFIGWRTIAWTLSDAIACTRELYEAGWFQWEQLPFLVPGLSREDVQTIQEEAYEELSPILERWHCSSAIALFGDSFYKEPEPRGAPIANSELAAPSPHSLYLLRSGTQYKVSLRLIPGIEVVHELRTDDPVATGQYWRRRFDRKHVNGNWYRLSESDVRAFTRREDS